MNLKEWYEEYWKDMGDEIDVERVEKIASLVKKGNVLDVGCGVGILSSRLMKDGFDVTAVDFSESACEKARKKGVNAIQSDVESGLPFEEGKFQNVVLAEVLACTYDPPKVLAEIHRVLAKDGNLIVTVPNIGHWHYRLSLLFGRFPYIDKIQTDRSNIRCFTSREIKDLLQKTGYNVKSMEGYTTLWSPVYDKVFTKPLIGRTARRIYPFLCGTWPSMFADKFIIVASKK
ncbi:MAG: class I SAM-dependent methyltransferase [Candidatus Altiarchaeota archaeon]